MTRGLVAWGRWCLVAGVPLVLGSGCYRGGFERWPTAPGGDSRRGGDGGDGVAGADAATDGLAPGDCAGDPGHGSDGRGSDGGGDGSGSCVWGPFGTPTPLSGLNSGDHDFDPVLSTDQLEIIWESDRTGGLGGCDLYHASRSTVSDAFGALTPLTSLNSPYYEGGAGLSSDGLTIFFDSYAPSGERGIFTATRPDHDSPFGAPALAGGILEIMGVGVTSLDLSGDDLAAYFSFESGTDSVLYVARRPTVGEPFSDVAQLHELDLPGTEAWPAISADEREIFFAYFPSGSTLGDIYTATRADRRDPFDPPHIVAEVSGAANEDDPDISADGRVLVFSSDRSGNADLWIATRACLP